MAPSLEERGLTPMLSGNYPSTMLRMVPLPTGSAGREDLEGKK
jgi:hypothetical protein